MEEKGYDGGTVPYRGRSVLYCTGSGGKIVKHVLRWSFVIPLSPAGFPTEPKWVLGYQLGDRKRYMCWVLYAIAGVYRINRSVLLTRRSWTVYLYIVRDKHYTVRDKRKSQGCSTVDVFNRCCCASRLLDSSSGRGLSARSGAHECLRRETRSPIAEDVSCIECKEVRLNDRPMNGQKR